MKNKNRKGLTSIGTIGSIVLVIAVVFIVLSINKDSFRKGVDVTNTLLDSNLELTLDKCREQTGSDHDKDGLPDFCDNCPLVSNTLGEDKDEDLYPKDCCGNDNFNFLKDPKKGYEPDNYKAIGWCRDAKNNVEPEDDTLTQKPGHPKYNPKWR